MVTLHSSPPIKRLLARRSLLGSFLLLLSVSQGCGVDESTKAYKNGLAALSRDDYDLAIADFSEAIRLNPSCADAYDHRGWAYDEKRDYDKAIADYSEAIHLDPNYALAYDGRASAYEHKGDHDKAIADYSELIRLHPEDADGYEKRGSAYLAWGFPRTSKDNCDKAIADYSEVIRINTNSARAYSWRADAYERRRDYDKAIADYSEAIRIKPDVLFYDDLATLYTFCPDANFRNGEKAVEYAKKACESSDRPQEELGMSKEMAHDWCLISLADAYAQAGNFDEAIKCVNELLRSNTSKDSDILRQRLSLYEQKKTYHQPSHDDER